MCSSGLFRSYLVLCLCAAVFIMLPHDLIAADENHGGITEYEIVSKAPMVIGKSDRTTSYFMNINVYSDPDLNLHSYSTYSIDYTNKENRLLEKELFQMVGTALAEGDSTGHLVRSDENPDILITMDFYTGKKEQYVPPKTVLTTGIQNVWTYDWGWGHNTPVPITQSHTTEGYTNVSYYRNIRLNFLDFKQLSIGEELEVPPLIWVGEVDSEGSSSDIRTVAPVILDQLLSEYPEKSGRVMHQRQVRKTRYGSIGVAVDPKDNRIVKYIEPGSPAAAAGLQVGDKLLRFINGRSKDHAKVGKDVLDVKINKRNPRSSWMTSGYYWDIIMNTKPDEVELMIKRAGVRSSISVHVTPVVKEYLW